MNILLWVMLAGVLPAGFPRGDDGSGGSSVVPVASNGLVRLVGVVFATNGGQRLMMDLVYPATNDSSAGLRPALIYVHGGGFTAGKRQSYARNVEWAARNGFVAATVDYRLADGRANTKFPAAIRDVAAAVRWLKTHAADHGVDPNRIALLGGSAGGNLALMAGLASEAWDQQPDRPWPDVDSRVQAIVNYCGPVDYVPMLSVKKKTATHLDVAKYLPGASPARKKEFARKAGPLPYLDEKDPPVLTMHGTADPVVPFHNAELLDQMMKEKGLRHRLVPLPGAGHDSFEDEPFKRVVDRETLAFLRDVFGLDGMPAEIHER